MADKENDQNDDQYKMKPTQRVSFDDDEAPVIDQGRKLAGRFAKSGYVSVNRFVKEMTLARTDEILGE